MSKQIKSIIGLNLLLMIYSFGGVCSKAASKFPLMSREFLILYGVMILLLGVFAICWQQIIKILPLTMAFANKAVTVVWGIIWGRVFFQEKITIGKLSGALIVIIGIVLFVISDKDGING